MGDTGLHAIKHAIKVGYRLLDTAHVYRNEDLVGRAVRECIEEGTRVVNLKFLMQGQAVLVWNFPNRAILKFSLTISVYNFRRAGHFGLKFIEIGSFRFEIFQGQAGLFWYENYPGRAGPFRFEISPAGLFCFEILQAGPFQPTNLQPWKELWNPAAKFLSPPNFTPATTTPAAFWMQLSTRLTC